MSSEIIYSYLVLPKKSKREYLFLLLTNSIIIGPIPPRIKPIKNRIFIESTPSLLNNILAPAVKKHGTERLNKNILQF